MKLRDPRAIPGLVSWLEEDFVADAARRAIVACGPVAVPPLLESLRDEHTSYGSETGASRRRRARILSILCELAPPAGIDNLEDLLGDPVDNIRWNAVRLFLEKGGTVQQKSAFRIGMEFLDSSDSFLRSECEELLLAHFDIGRELIEAEIHRRQTAGESDKNFEPRETTLAILYRIFRRASEANGQRRAQVS